MLILVFILSILIFEVVLRSQGGLPPLEKDRPHIYESTPIRSYGRNTKVEYKSVAKLIALYLTPIPATSNSY